ncbi:MAG: hypothetical protein K2I36_01070 [Ureaplasma sp.]|nr:hypothetical protein [Ureaplasma sp.]MDE7221736.1 hypothetical protein [Ureaplasma sp.]
MKNQIYPSVNELLKQYDYCFCATFIKNPKSKKYGFTNSSKQDLAKELLAGDIKLKDYWKNK